MIILFPSEPFSPKEVDTSFQSEYEAAKLIGFKVFLFDHDEFVASGRFKSDLPLVNGNAQELILRSWMLKQEQYQKLYSELFAKHYLLFNDVEQYVQCHHFPEYYKYISEYTSKAWWSNTWSEHPYSKREEEAFWHPVRNMLGDINSIGDIIIKDYVKSEKGNPDLFILNKKLTNDEFNERVHKFVEARGKLFNEGIVFKKVEALKRYEDKTNEWRMFFLNGELMMLGQNSDAPARDIGIPSSKIMLECTKIAKKVNSNFCTIDIAEKEDGEWMILELGDGQVSGMPLVGDAIAFYNRMNAILNKIEN